MNQVWQLVRKLMDIGRQRLRDREYEMLGYATFPLNPRAALLEGRDRLGHHIAREEWAELVGWREFIAPGLARLVMREWLALPLTPDEEALLDCERTLRKLTCALFEAD